MGAKGGRPEEAAGADDGDESEAQHDNWKRQRWKTQIFTGAANQSFVITLKSPGVLQELCNQVTNLKGPDWPSCRLLGPHSPHTGERSLAVQDHTNFPANRVVFPCEALIQYHNALGTNQPAWFDNGETANTD